MTQGLETQASSLRGLERLLDEAFQTTLVRARMLLLQSEDERQELALRLRREGAKGTLASLRFKESVLSLQVGLPEQAFSTGHEAWTLVQKGMPGEVQALVLTQMGACFQARGDLRAAQRAVRRAEALLVSECGEDLPQVLAVRAQLLGLMRAAGRDEQLVRLRAERCFRRLGRQVRDLAGAFRYECLRKVFLESPDPPPWALVFQMHWRNVYAHKAPGP